MIETVVKILWDGVISCRPIFIVIAPQIKACQNDEGREEIYQGRKPQEYSCIARLSDAEKFSIWQVLLARFSWGSNNACEDFLPRRHLFLGR